MRSSDDGSADVFFGVVGGPMLLVVDVLFLPALFTRSAKVLFNV